MFLSINISFEQGLAMFSWNEPWLLQSSIKQELLGSEQGFRHANMKFGVMSQCASGPAPLVDTKSDGVVVENVSLCGVETSSAAKEA